MKHAKSLIAIVAVTALISATSGLSAQTTAPKRTAANSSNLTFEGRSSRARFVFHLFPRQSPISSQLGKEANISE